MDVKILVQQTPNPNARKFITNQVVKSDGKATFSSKQEGAQLTLVRDLFDISGVEQVHLFDNFVTVTKGDESPDWLLLEPQIRSIIQTRLPIHDANFQAGPTLLEAHATREGLSPELKKIEEILDRTIRPGLQGDGGDLEVVNFDHDKKTLDIRYQGACGTCPSSIAGTLQAIESILQNEFHESIEVRSV